MDSHEVENTPRRVADLAGQAALVAAIVSEAAGRVAEHAPRVVDQVSHTAGAVAGRVAERAPHVVDQVSHTARDMAGRVAERAPQVVDQVSHTARGVAGRMSHAADQSTGVATRVSDEVGEFVAANRRTSTFVTAVLALLTLIMVISLIRAPRVLSE